MLHIRNCTMLLSTKPEQQTAAEITWERGRKTQLRGRTDDICSVIPAAVGDQWVEKLIVALVCGRSGRTSLDSRPGLWSSVAAQVSPSHFQLCFLPELAAAVITNQPWRAWMPIQLITNGTNGACVTGVLGTMLVCASTTKNVLHFWVQHRLRTVCSTDDSVFSFNQNRWTWIWQCLLCWFLYVQMYKVCWPQRVNALSHLKIMYHLHSTINQ